MSTATVTADGQITIPKQVRLALGMEAGDEVVFIVADGKAILHPVPHYEFSQLRGIVRSPEPFPGREAERAAAHRAVLAHTMKREQED